MNMVLRRQYLEKLRKTQGSQIIKVITGVRRCGKSTLLAQFQDELQKSGVGRGQIVSVNLEDIANKPLLDYLKLYDYLLERLQPGKMTYVFLDEIQNVQQFQRAVDSLYIKPDVDVYLTGSNASLLSGELATLLSGRYIEINMLPLSYAEYYELLGGDRRDTWNSYYRKGGFPFAATIEDEEVWRDYLLGIYHTVLIKDIVARKGISDVGVLESVAGFLFDNIGNIVSSKRIADSLTSFGRKTNSTTVESYISALTESFILYKAGRYNIKGKQHLKSLEKYYLVDISLRRILLGDSSADVGHILENIVYLELIRRGYQVRIGKVGELEINFIAFKGSDRRYYQVAASVLDPVTFTREMASLKAVKDNYPKSIISLDELPMEEEGIKQINMIDFLLQG
jgi:predicted AAA+ superfamily ATPase